jgi:RHS repeat-associated protein
VVSDIERDALHREVRRSQGRLLSEYAYDPAGRLTAQRVRLAQSPAAPGAGHAAIDPHTGRPTRLTGLIERRYGYDAAGQLRQWLDRERGLTQYAYDPVGRIVGSRFGVRQRMEAPSVGASPASATRSEHFHWDAASNPVPPPSAGQPVRPVAGNRLLVWQDEAYRYDAHGNLTDRLQGKRGSAAQTHTRLQWDGAHQLVQASVTRGAGPGATTQDFAYAYDALGRRVAKIDAFGTTAFAWDGDRMLLEQRASHEVLHLYEPESFVPLAQVHGGVVHHLHTDHLGTPLEASNDAGEITWRVTYRTWGSVVVEDVAEIAQRVRFQGQYLDVETGLHYNRFRYYEPGAGRFVSQDPIGLAGG